MATGATIYGCIETPWGILYKAHRRHNVRVIEHLPREDPWPPLIGKMFGITGPTVREGAYDHDLIHFGATLKSLDDAEAIVWIEKFEALLRRLVWFRAVMHIEWIFGARKFQWEADRDQVREALENKGRRVIDRWTFDTGGRPLEP